MKGGARPRLRWGEVAGGSTTHCFDRLINTFSNDGFRRNIREMTSSLLSRYAPSLRPFVVTASMLLLCCMVFALMSLLHDQMEIVDLGPDYDGGFASSLPQAQSVRMFIPARSFVTKYCDLYI